MMMHYYLIIMLIIIMFFIRGHTLKLKKKAFRLDVARNHFCNRVVSVWNGLPEHVVTAAPLTLFKNYLRTLDFSSYTKFDRNL